MALLVACKDDAASAATPPAPATTAHIGAEVPPPPQIAGVVTAQADAPADAASAQALTSTRAQLESLLTGAASCSADSECKSVATGGKACGGPTAYRAYSAKGPNANQIPDLAQKERDQSLEQARASHQASPCFMIADPGAHCEASKCATGPGASVK